MQQRPVVIFLHGLACTSAAFDPLFADPILTSRLFMVSRPSLLFYRLNNNPSDVQIRYDTRGHGRTGGPDNPEGYASKRMSLHYQYPQRSMELKGGSYSVR
jgi:pimeloyl-ACP methyl ester carboxylesterase